MYNYSHLMTKTLTDQNPLFIRQIPDFLLIDLELEAHKFILEYFETTGSLPTHALVFSKFGSNGVILKTSPIEDLHILSIEVMSFLKERYASREINKILNTYYAGDSINIESLLNVAQKVQSIGIVKSQNIADYNRETLYDVKNLDDIIHTGFKIVDEKIGGVLPGELLMIVARPATGKTTLVCHEAVQWALQGQKVLFISIEMKTKQIVHKIDAILGSFNSRVFRDASISDLERQTYLRHAKEKAQEIIKNGGNIIFPDERTPVTTVNQVRQQVHQHNPDIVIIDGLYLLKDDSSNDAAGWQKIMNIVTQIKNIAMEARDGKGIKFVVTSQLKRGTGSNPNSIDLEAIAFGDSIGQTADSCIAMWCDSEQPGITQIEVIKARYGETSGISQMSIDHDKSIIKDSPIAVSVISLSGKKNSGVINFFPPSEEE